MVYFSSGWSQETLSSWTLYPLEFLPQFPDFSDDVEAGSTVLPAEAWDAPHAPGESLPKPGM